MAAARCGQGGPFVLFKLQIQPLSSFPRSGGILASASVTGFQCYQLSSPMRQPSCINGAVFLRGTAG